MPNPASLPTYQAWLTHVAQQSPLYNLIVEVDEDDHVSEDLRRKPRDMVPKRNSRYVDDTSHSIPSSISATSPIAQYSILR